MLLFIQLEAHVVSTCDLTFGIGTKDFILNCVVDTTQFETRPGRCCVQHPSSIENHWYVPCDQPRNKESHKNAALHEIGCLTFENSDAHLCMHSILGISL